MSALDDWTGAGIGEGVTLANLFAREQPDAGAPVVTLWASGATLLLWHAVTGLGWLGGTDHACPGRLTFQIVAGGAPDPDPEPPSDFEAHVIALLTRIATGIERLSAHLGT